MVDGFFSFYFVVVFVAVAFNPGAARHNSKLFRLFQVAHSLQPSSPPRQRRQYGPSGKASNMHRTTQSSILKLRETSKTCSL
jgi:hypothetical protein